MNKFCFYKSEKIEYVFIKGSTIHFDEHCHAFDFIITKILCGNVVLRKNGILQTVSTNHIFKVAPYEPHALFSEMPITAITMCIKKELIYSGDREGFKKQIINSLSAISDTFDDIKQFEKLFSEFYNVALEFFDEYYAFEEDDNSPYVISRNEIEMNPEEEKRLVQLAQETFVSKYHYIRKFKACAGLTPHKFQIQNRIRKSQRQLMKGKSVADAAILAGFFDQSHFNKYFKKIVGISPREYKDSVCNFLQDPN